MKNKLPSFQFYPGDWRKDPAVQALNYHDRGIWFEILLLMFESPERGKLMLKQSTAMPENALARLLGIDLKQLRQTLQTLVEYGVATLEPGTGAITSPRMIRDEKFRNMRAEAGKLGGSSRPGQPNDKQTIKQNPKQTGQQTTEQNPPPSSSSSISSSPSGDEDKETSFPFAPHGTSSATKQEPRGEETSSVISWSQEHGFTGISGTDRSRWLAAFPAVDLDRSIAAASEWLLRNPQKRKKHHGRFLSGWLSRAQERGGDLASTARPGAAGYGYSPALPQTRTPLPKLPWE